MLKLIDVEEKNITVSDVEIPVFRNLYQIKGHKDSIEKELSKLAEDKKQGWVSIEITESGVSSSIRTISENITKDTGLEVIHIKDTTVSKRLMEKEETIENLESLSEEDIFLKFLDEKEIKEERKEELLSLLREIMASLNETEE